MMQLLCNNKPLDLYEGTGLQLKKNNPAFAFDTMSAERTTNLKIPATPNNDRIFGCAKIPAYSGGAMRKKFNATLIDGIVTMQGFLYVASFDGKDYNAVFVGGLAYDLKAFTASDWGKLIFPTPYVTDTVYDANASSIPTVARVKFHSNDGIRKPSINLGALFNMLNSSGAFRISGVAYNNLRLIRTDRYAITDARARLINGPNARDLDLDLSTDNGLVHISRMLVYVDQDDYEFYANCFQVDGECTITFPEDTPQNLCCCYVSTIATEGPAYSIRFFGTRKFVRVGGQTVYTGEPLAGKTVRIDMPNLDNRYCFVLMTADGALYGNDGYYYFTDYYGGGFMDYVPQYDVQVKISCEDYRDAFDPHGVPALAMVQDLNLGDLLKMYAACNGLLINVRRDGSVQFINSISGDDKTYPLMKQTEVKRTFADYAQKNVLQFNSDDTVAESERMRAYYTVPNINIEESKELLTINASEGGIYNQVYVVVRGDADTLGITGNWEFMRRVALQKNNFLQTLCDASTQIRVQLRMDMYNFTLIDSATHFNVRGTRYTWTEATWQSGVADLTLAKVE